MAEFMKKHSNEQKEFGPGFEKYFYLHYDKQSRAFLFPEEKTGVIEEELGLSGYFVIITSEKMNAREALTLYKSRDGSEKLFRGVTNHTWATEACGYKNRNGTSVGQCIPA